MRYVGNKVRNGLVGRVMEYGCIGERLVHSFSKEIHAALADYNYELVELGPNEIPEFFSKRQFKAINVTIPYKTVVMEYLDEIDEASLEIGAVNTVVNRNGRLYGYNTDFFGMCELLRYNNISLLGKKVLILGGGGTSKTSFAVAKSCGAKEIFVVSRTKREGTITYEEALTAHKDAQVIINTTPVGMFPNIDEAPIDIDAFHKLEAVVDAVYNPLNSMLVQTAKDKGIKATGGLYMLVMQAVLAVEHFLDKKVEEKRATECYKRVLASKQNLVLIGMPTSGKSTLGRKAANQTAMDFIDIDAEIVKKQNKPIPQIFEECGEKGFRDIESAVIKDIAARQTHVIATGGGAVLRPENIKALKLNGIVCFLDRAVDKLLITDDRPLSSTRENLERLYKERYALYCSAADFKVDCVESIEENIKKILEGFRNESSRN